MKIDEKVYFTRAKSTDKIKMKPRTVSYVILADF
jgi:hypothetical protein